MALMWAGKHRRANQIARCDSVWSRADVQAVPDATRWGKVIRLPRGRSLWPLRARRS
ncbi:protein of unknown function [Burkholderia multivorans]